MTTPAVPYVPVRTDLPNGWRGPIAALDVPTGDERMLMTPEGGVRTRVYPLSLTRDHVGGATPAPVIGNLLRAWTADGFLHGEGRLDIDGEAGAEAARQLAAGMINTVSIDPDEVSSERMFRDVDGTMSAEMPDGADPDDYDTIIAFTDWRLAGVALVPVPAYTQARIEPVWDYTPSQVLPSDAIVSASAQPDFSDHSMVALRPARPNSFAVRGGSVPGGLHVTLAYLGQGLLPDHVVAAGHAAAQAAAMALHPDSTATVAGYGHLGDSMNPATVLFLNGPAVHAAHQAAAGAMAGVADMPEQHSPYMAHMTLGYGVPLAAARPFVGRRFALKGASFDHTGTTTHYAKPISIVSAGATGGQVFTRSFFTDPKLEGPTPMTVTADGHVYGHVRLAGTCYQYGGGQGNGGRCLEPPPSRCGYAKFMTHGARMDDDSIMSVGALTFGDGHVSRGGLEASRKHYDDVATVAAKVVAGEDEFGVWISGEVVEEYRDRAYDLLLSPLSGHWEPDADNRGHLEMLAAHLVVTPGYSVPRIVASFDGDSEITGIILTEQYESTESEQVVSPEMSARALVAGALAESRRVEELARRIGAPRRGPIVAAAGMAIAAPDAAWDGAGAASRMLDRATKDKKIDVGAASAGFVARTGDGSKRGDYHLPFADVHGGALTVIPRGVSAAAGRVNQTQGIDQAAARSRICGLYGRIRGKYPDWPECPLENSGG